MYKIFEKTKFLDISLEDIPFRIDYILSSNEKFVSDIKPYDGILKREPKYKIEKVKGVWYLRIY